MNAIIVINAWYENNMTNVTSNLEDTIWCNDRSHNNTGGSSFSSSGYFGVSISSTTIRNFDPYSRSKPVLSCRINDAFSVSDNTNGNGALTYPVATITMDEAKLSGLANSNESTEAFLNIGVKYNTMTPGSYANGKVVGRPIVTNGGFQSDGAFSLTTSIAARPSISLNNNARVTIGDGSKNEPYQIIFEEE